MIITKEKYFTDLLKLIKKIEVRPEIFLGEASITKFKCFLDGFAEAYTFFDSEHKAFGFFNGFQEWIEDKYDIHICQSWANIILFYSNNEAEAFELFKKDFEMFFQIKMKNQKMYNRLV